VIIGEESDNSIPLADEVETSSETADLTVVLDRGEPGPAAPQEIPEARPVTQEPLFKKKDSRTKGGAEPIRGASKLPVVSATIVTVESDSRKERKRSFDQLAQERRDPKGAADQQRGDRVQRRAEGVLNRTQQSSANAEKVADREEADSESEGRKLRGREFLPQD
jgi:hypothetical protein